MKNLLELESIALFKSADFPITVLNIIVNDNAHEGFTKIFKIEFNPDMTLTLKHNINVMDSKSAILTKALIDEGCEDGAASLVYKKIEDLLTEVTEISAAHMGGSEIAEFELFCRDFATDCVAALKASL